MQSSHCHCLFTNIACKGDAKTLLLSCYVKGWNIRVDAGVCDLCCAIGCNAVLCCATDTRTVVNMG